MTIKRAKKLWKYSKVYFNLGFLFWIAETIYFLIKHGWHWKAINEQEQICDNIASVFIMAGALLTAYVATVLLNTFLRDKN